METPAEKPGFFYTCSEAETLDGNGFFVYF